MRAGPVNGEEVSATEADGGAERSLADRIADAGAYLRRTARLMVGVPDYEAYLAHCERTHPGEPVMSYEAFFRDRLEARYGAARAGRCC